jgi:hypothetical protein
MGGAAHIHDALEMAVEVCIFFFPEIASIAMKARSKACQVVIIAYLVQLYRKKNLYNVLKGIVDVNEAIVAEVASHSRR